MPRVDVVIVGGGVTGLLVLRGVVAAGYSAVLFESEKLGGGQTGHSQAYLIHGHLYSLSAGEPGGVRTAVFGADDRGGADTPFRRGAHAWSELLRELEITAARNAYHLVPQGRRSRTLEAWEAADLEFTHVSRKNRPLPLVAEDPSTGPTRHSSPTLHTYSSA